MWAVGDVVLYGLKLGKRGWGKQNERMSRHQCCGDKHRRCAPHSSPSSPLQARARHYAQHVGGPPHSDTASPPAAAARSPLAVPLQAQIVGNSFGSHDPRKAYRQLQRCEMRSCPRHRDTAMSKALVRNHFVASAVPTRAMKMHTVRMQNTK